MNATLFDALNDIQSNDENNTQSSVERISKLFQEKQFQNQFNHRNARTDAIIRDILRCVEDATNRYNACNRA
jgi:hypothetical protein